MQSTCTTGTGLSMLIGTSAVYSVAPFSFNVTILDAKVTLGNLRLYIRPIAGSGECWVDATKVRPVKE